MIGVKDVVFFPRLPVDDNDNDYELLDFAYVTYRVDAGDRIKFIHDFYGGQWVELRHRLFFWVTRRVRLEADEFQAVRDQVSARKRRSKAPAGLTISLIKDAFGAGA